MKIFSRRRLTCANPFNLSIRGLLELRQYKRVHFSSVQDSPQTSLNEPVGFIEHVRYAIGVVIMEVNGAYDFFTGGGV